MTVRILTGDCRDLLATLRDESVRCVVTSPPYWGLRDYGTTGQIGLERTPGEYIESMVGVFRDVRRVLAKDGTLWLNMGDSYCTSPNSGTGWESSTLTKPNGRPRSAQIAQLASMRGTLSAERDVAGLKPKDLVMMPARLALALQADGWYLRQDIVWHKPNPMPESVTDRCTKAHEYVFLLSRSERYFYDGDAIREELSGTAHGRGGRDVPANWNQNGFDARDREHGERTARNNWKTPDGWDTSKGDGAHGTIHKDGREKGKKRSGNKERKAASERGVPVDTNGSTNGAVAGSVPWEDSGNGRNKRSVWTVPSQPFKEAHFATFPPALIEPCILAGSAKGDTVLDPFGGAGTTGLVADRLGRNAILLELNPEYAAMAERRIKGDSPLFAEVTQ